MNPLFDTAPAWLPTAGVLIFIYILFASGNTFWAMLAVVAALLLFAGGLK